MKKILLPAVLIAALLFTGCKKNDVDGDHDRDKDDRNEREARDESIIYVIGQDSEKDSSKIQILDSAYKKKEEVDLGKTVVDNMGIKFLTDDDKFYIPTTDAKSNKSSITVYDTKTKQTTDIDTKSPVKAMDIDDDKLLYSDLESSNFTVYDLKQNKEVSSTSLGAKNNGTSPYLDYITTDDDVIYAHKNGGDLQSSELVYSGKNSFDLNNKIKDVDILGDKAKGLENSDITLNDVYTENSNLYLIYNVKKSNNYSTILAVYDIRAKKPVATTEIGQSTIDSLEENGNIILFTAKDYNSNAEVQTYSTTANKVVKTEKLNHPINSIASEDDYFYIGGKGKIYKYGEDMKKVDEGKVDLKHIIGIVVE